MKPARLSWCLLAVCLAAVGCSRGFEIQTPASFAELEKDDDFGYRATSAEGVVIGIRSEDNDPKGNLAFWANAVRYELERRGYSLEQEQAVKAQSGTAGTRLEYRYTKNGRPYVFWAAVFVTNSRVVIVEAGGDAAHFGKVESEVNAAINSVDV